MTQHILTLDVGFANMGWMVLYNHKPIACGTIHTDKVEKRVAEDYATRSATISKGLQDIIYTYNVKAIVGELPHGGAQSAKAGVMMGMAIAVTGATASFFSLPTEWSTPKQGKEALVGKATATKEEMMDACTTKLGGGVLQQGKSEYYFIPDCKGAEKLRKNVFEHIADAYGAYLALKNSTVVKMFV